MQLNEIIHNIKSIKLFNIAFKLWKKGICSDFGMIVFGFIITYILRLINHADTIESIENNMNGIFLTFFIINLSFGVLLLIIKYFSYIDWIYRLLRDILSIAGNYIKLQKGSLFLIFGVAVSNEYLPQFKYLSIIILWLAISLMYYLLISVKEAIRIKLRTQRNDNVK